jgi:hypothetical protein
MRKLFAICMIIILGMVAYSQERTVDLNAKVLNSQVLNLTTSSKVTYTSTTTLDRLIPTTRDTIDFTLWLYAPVGPIRPYIEITLDTIAGADTTVSVTIQEKKNYDEAWTDLIAAANTSAISAETKVIKTSLGVTTEQTSAVYNTVLFYNYLRIRLIIRGNDSVGTGIKVKKVQIQFWM